MNDASVKFMVSSYEYISAAHTFQFLSRYLCSEVAAAFILAHLISVT